MNWIQRKPIRKPNNDDSTLERIAKIRGIKDYQKFLNPTEEELHDPYSMKNIQDASNRIIKAIDKNERIIVSYDPDADGLTATTIMLRYLKNYTDNVDYIYGERSDGHGITEMIKVSSLDPSKDAERIDHNKLNTDKIRNADLLILIDSSSNDVETCKFIKEKLNTDIIILDHHAIECKNPYVLLVNQQQDGCEYPNKYLSGAGVVFKTIQVMEDTLNQVDVWQYIDLVAVGLYADVMRLDILENRYLIMQGLRNMKNAGLVRILKGGKVNMYKMKGDAIGFTIAPMLNGAARMDNIKLAIDILLEDDDKVCKKIRLQMHKLNQHRKEKQKEITEQYKKNIDDTKKVLIVTDEQSSKGFNGIVAQQLSEEYKRPVIVGRIHNGKLSGSFRSYNGFKFKRFLNQFDGELDALGHEGAGGIEISQDLLPDLEKYIERHMPSLEDVKPTVYYDLGIGVDEVDQYVKELDKFNLLTGNGFPKVIVRVNGISVEEPSCIGETRETVKIGTLNDMELIKFRVNEEYASELGYFDMIDVVGQLTMNEWFNFATRKLVAIPQVILHDYVKS
ncbi:DHH family phosphoesterase [Bacillus haynesii]|uniref:single-stranded-DNA-specific exonuclease RecJ n=1 Tax=Bacillus haynesii TaxID=1925021 RepID=UPI00227E958A|nr:DHH family phosphoesterase [Bacillus haynesii]MCY8549407.1 DHH family phosphoesterase [Bacillus haynesii]